MDAFMDQSREDGEAAMLEALRDLGATIDPLRSSRAALSPDEDLDLGDDNFSIRRRALAARSAVGPRCTAAAPHPGLDPLDLNLETNLLALEDPGLKRHMDQARLGLAAHEKGQTRPPSVEELAGSDRKLRLNLSAMVVALKEQQMRLQCALDEVLLQGTNIERISKGEQPHGFPPVRGPVADPRLTSGLQHLAKKISEAGGELEQVSAALKCFEADLTLVRRSYETVVDGLRRQCSVPVPAAGNQ